MTLSAFPPYTYYVGDGVLTSFAYPFEVERPEDFVAFHNDVLVTNYTLSGLGDETGGQCTFSAPPPLNTSILLLRRVDLDQETMYPAYSPFPAAAHEKTLDRLCMQIWHLQEQLERTTRFKQTIDPAHRNLLYPDPIPNGLLGWDSAAAQWTLHPSGVQQITVNPISGIGSGKNVVALTPAFGTGQAQALVFPAGVLAVAVTVWIETTFGTTQGLQAIGIGTPEAPDRWGYLTQLTADSTTTAGLFQGYSGQPQLSGGVLTLTAYGGAFDGTGTAYMTGHFLTFQPSRTVGMSYTPGAEETPPGLQAASETVVGVTRYGTTAETIAGLLNSVATHPSGVQAALNAALSTRVPAGTPFSVTRYGASGTTLETGSATVVIDAAGNLGVGTTSPEHRVDVEGGNVRVLNGALLVHRDGASATLVQDTWAPGAAFANAVTANRYGGTIAAPAAAPVAAKLYVLTCRASDGTTPQTGATLEFEATGQFGAAERGTRLRVSTVASGSTTLAERLGINAQGNVTMQGVLTGRVVVAVTTATVTAPLTLTPEDSGTVYYAANTTEKAQINLPLAVTGLTYTVIIYAAQGMRIRAATGDIIRAFGVGSSVAAGYFESTTLYSALTLVAVNQTYWMATSITGTWVLGV